MSKVEEGSQAREKPIVFTVFNSHFSPEIGGRREIYVQSRVLVLFIIPLWSFMFVVFFHLHVIKVMKVGLNVVRV